MNNIMKGSETHKQWDAYACAWLELKLEAMKDRDHKTLSEVNRQLQLMADINILIEEVVSKCEGLTHDTTKDILTIEISDIKRYIPTLYAGKLMRCVSDGQLGDLRRDLDRLVAVVDNHKSLEVYNAIT